MDRGSWIVDRSDKNLDAAVSQPSRPESSATGDPRSTIHDPPSNPKPKGKNLLPLLDLLILKEIVGPWIFGVGMFTSLLMAGTFLGRLTGYLSDGVPFITVLKAFCLLMPAILAKTFPMAVLLAALLSFGRLSGDSEITALRAAGASIYRVVRPASFFSLAVAILAFGFNEIVVPPATQSSLALANEIVKVQRPSEAFPVAQTIVKDGILRLGIVAQDTKPLQQTLQGVTLSAYDEKGELMLIVEAKELLFKGADQANGWRVSPGSRILFADGSKIAEIDGEIWPENVPTIPTSFTDLIKPRDDDFDAKSMVELGRNIARYKADRSKTKATIANYEYGYWNKIALPLSAVVFGTLGAVLGIRNARTGTAAGFALAVGIIFGYVTTLQFMNQWALGGVIPPWAASFTPIVLGLGAACFIMFRKNA